MFSRQKKKPEKLTTLTTKNDFSLVSDAKGAVASIGGAAGFLAGGIIGQPAIAAALGLSILGGPVTAAFIGVAAGMALGATAIGYYDRKNPPKSKTYKKEQLKVFNSIANFFEKHKKGKFSEHNGVSFTFGSTGTENYELKEYSSPSQTEIHYAVMHNNTPLFQWRKKKKKQWRKKNKKFINMFMFKRAIIYINDGDGDKFGSNIELVWGFPDPITFDKEKKQIILPMNINDYPKMEKNSITLQMKLSEAIDNFKAAGERAKKRSKFQKLGKKIIKENNKNKSKKTKSDLEQKMEKQRIELYKAELLKKAANKPAFDPLPFLGDIQQKEHKVYKNLRY